MQQLVDRYLRKAEALSHQMVVVTIDNEQALYVCAICRQSFVVENRPAIRTRRGPTKPQLVESSALTDRCSFAKPAPADLTACSALGLGCVRTATPVANRGI